ncbi:MAG: hypothetical protein KJO40_13715 [Deltaproteobacteria bacterium]|nr:hypothetical protein [Deltaproteobacteria bacterium]
MIYYAAIDPDGNILGVEPTADEAVDLALDARPDATVAVEELPKKSNPARYEQEDNPSVRKSVMRMGLKEIHGYSEIPSSAAKMKLEEAHARVLPYFKGLSSKDGKEVTAYNTVGGMTDAFIGQNYKTKKKHPETKSKVMGLSLTPHHFVYEVAYRPKVYNLEGERAMPVPFTTLLRRRLPKKPRAFSLCTGSTRMCRDACLVHSGMNSGPVYNTHRKSMQTAALLNEPEAFMRILMSAVKKHECVAPAEGYLPFMRLNVLSDICWEAIAPWFFDHFSGLKFYDYTKIPGRVVPDNYDMTFSYGGGEGSERLCKREIETFGRKVAVVFIGHKPAKGDWTPLFKEKEYPMPETFWGLPVLDGDVSDVRPLDKVAPAIVGLRWKVPSGERAGLARQVDPTAEKYSFVTPTYIVEGKALYKHERPNPNPNREQFMIAAATPRFESIIHSVGLP